MDVLLTVLIAIPFGGLLSALVSYVSRSSMSNRVRETNEQRVERLTKSLTEALQVIDEIQADIRERHETATQLKADVERFEALRDMSETQVEAVVQSLRGELSEQGKQSFWRNFAVNFTFFIMGVGVTVGVTLLA